MRTPTTPIDITMRDRLGFALLAPVMAGWLWREIRRGRIAPREPLAKALRKRPGLAGEGTLQQIQAMGGLAFAASIPEHFVDDALGRSTLTLMEDDRPLGPAHAPHREIVELGGGRFSHWDGRVWFSSSDGSDPRTNGRRYRWRVRPAPVVRPRPAAALRPRGASGAAAQDATKSPAPLAERLALHALRCPECLARLDLESEALVCTLNGHRWPVVRGIPRFVASDQYVASFSFEWNTHSDTQLDSARHSTESERMFRRKTGLTPEQVRGALVLDAGVGAGRFADVLLKWGATVIGVDLSQAVEASARNFADRREALICQADIGRLPFAEGTFDYIVSIGVLHHTPDTRAFFSKLPPLLKPGGEIAIWVYPDGGDYAKRNPWIPLTGRLPPKLFHGFCKVLTHWMHRRWHHPLAQWIHDVFPVSNQGLGLENDILDTFDGYSPRFHGTHGTAEVMEWFRTAGLEEVRELEWPTAVRGRRPAPAPAPVTPSSPLAQAADCA